ncbi:MAG TPA: hypothetical protein VEQ10_16730 [Vicinamibacteria bacterium]|nr:hypothetical protein [Vicinamibacteria bacterium]
MSRQSGRVGRTSLFALGFLAGAAALLAAPPSDMNGRWELVPQHSDDVREKVEESLGTGYSRGDIKEDSPRVLIHDWLVQQAEKPSRLVLTIEQGPAEFRSFLGDEVRIYYFGREATREGPLGGLRKATVRRERDRVVVEEKAVKGSGRILETYELRPDGSLLLTWHLEHKSMQKPLDLRLSFRKAAT